MELRDINLKLTIELVPSTVWYASLYQKYKKENTLDKWYKIKNKLFRTEGHQCWICCKKQQQLEAHEFWEYDNINHIQRLIAIHHLCDLCHKIKHIGFWCYTPDGIRKLSKANLTKEDLINHFCKVNTCNKDIFQKHETIAFKIWKDQSQYKWKQDFSKYPGLNI